MKLGGIIFKVIAAIAVVMLIGFEGGAIWDGIFLFCMAYGLVTYYMWYVREHGHTLIGGNIILFVLSLFLPLFIMVLPYYILNAVLPGQVGLYVGGIIYIALCGACVASDAITVIRTFNPSFMEGFDLGASVKKIFSKNKDQ